MPNEFDALMSGMGVKRLDKKEPAKPARKAVRKTAKQSPSKPIPKNKPTGARAEPAAVSTADRIVALERGLELVKSEREKAEARVSSQRKKIKRLNAEVSELKAAAAVPPVSISTTLTEWGYETEEDRQIVLYSDGWLERVIGEPRLSEAHELRDELARAFVQVCDRCEASSGQIPLPCKPDSCSTCGGFDVAGEARRFLDAVLINGRLRVVIVGRDADHQRLIRSAISDTRLVLTQIPGTTKRETSQAQIDVDHADAVVVWDPDSVSPDLLEVYRRASRMGEVPPGPVGALLSAAAAIVAQD